MKGGAALLTAIFAANLFGTAVGFIYYGNHLAATNPLLWLFVPDCPLYTGLFALLILLAVSGKRSDLFGFIVSIGLMKYGAWTLFALTFYGSYFFSQSWLMIAQSAVLFVLHIGMTAEGFVLPVKKIRLWHVVAALAWFLLNDYMDYFGPMTHPIIPSLNIAPAMMFSLACTVGLTLVAYVLCKKGIRIRINGLS